MELTYQNKLSIEDIRSKSSNGTLIKKNKVVSKNKLLFGDNLFILNKLCQDPTIKGKVDLIYIDPPFATNNTFTIDEGRASTISNSKNGVVAYKDDLTGIEFIEFLRERLVLLKELLSPEGSIYLHIDYKIGHYVKVMMDEVFGINNFRNDITRIKCNPKNFKRKGYGNIKDLILFYSNSNKLIWNEPKTSYTERDIERLFPKKDKNGRHYTTVPIHAPGETKSGDSGKPFKGIYPPKGRHWRTSVKELDELDSRGLIEWSSTGNPRMIIYSDEKDGKRVQDIWEFKDPQYPLYPTQKNSDMLDLIIKTSSNINSIVLDCFCGSGSTLLSAVKNQRHWIGIDRSEEAIKVFSKSLKKYDDELFKTFCEYEYYELEK